MTEGDSSVPDAGTDFSTDIDTNAGSDSGADGETESGADVAELTVNFGDGGNPFILHLYDNDTARAVARHVGTADWRLPILFWRAGAIKLY